MTFPKFTPSEVTVSIGPTTGRLILWSVRGIKDTEGRHVYYPCEIVAQAAARIHFPDEDVITREGRIFYTTRYVMEEEKP